MAGTPSGAAAPTPSKPTISRTRCCHGFFTLGTVPGAIFSSRRGDDIAGVIVDLGRGGTVATGRMSSTQARSAARALLAAAEAVDNTQRRQSLTRSAR